MLFAQEVLNNLENGESSGRKMGVGIHAGCSVSKVELGDNFIDFHYENAEKAIHNKRIFFPTIDKVYQNDGESIVDALKRSEEEAFGQIVRHLRIFLSPEELNLFSAPDVRSAAVKAEAIITPRLATKKVNLKILYDKNGQYTEVPKQKFSKYIETYVEGQAPTLEFTDWETKNRLTYKGAPSSSTPDPVQGNDETRVY